MNSKLIGLAVVALVLVAGVGAAFVTGVADSPVGASERTNSNAPQETYEKTVVVEQSSKKASTGGQSADESGEAQQKPPFSFHIKQIEDCGQTCREVTASITNNQEATAEGVVVRSVIYTGGDKIWEGQNTLGDIATDEQVTDTKTVKLGYMAAYKVKQNDGEILVKTYVTTGGVTYVYSENRDVL